MRFAILISTFVLLATISACQRTAQDSAADAPSLVILLSVDQLRADLLTRYDSLFVGGLRRLLDEGHRFANATHDHAMTSTAPGHATLATGVYPTRHGIVANSWSEFIEDEWRSVYSVEDLDSKILGYPDLPGRSSSNINRRGLADWIADSDPDSRMVSVSRKDRSAIGLAARAVGDVYWLVDRGGEFVTSEFYHSEYPAWVTEFNANTMPQIYSDSVWESIVPSEARALTRPDTSAFELRGEQTAFPHWASDFVDPSDPGAMNRWRYEYTPFPDRAVVSFALRAIDVLQLGQRESLDYLGISLSQTDIVGHRFGPLSREQLDNLLRLDRELGRLFSGLDDSVGPGRWVLAMSADHGVLDVPEHLAEAGVDAARQSRAEVRQLQRLIQTALERADEERGIEDAVKAALMTGPAVAGVYTFSEVERGTPADSFQVFYSRSHSRTRVTGLAGRAGVYMRLEPNVLAFSTSAASHGSPYYYDRHVPMIFLGGSIQAGVSTDRVATVDVAPTLAWLTSTTAPDDLDGRVLERVLRR